jgi:class 3 adenylate cyclase/PAS domain-containing protein
VTVFFEVRWIRLNKERTYHCLAALPKSTLSELAERLRGIKKEQDSEVDVVSNASETTKREENVMKILNTGGSSDSKIPDLAFLFAAKICSALGYCAIVVLFFQLLISEATIFSPSASHFENVLGGYSWSMAALYYLHRLYLYDTDLAIHFSDPASTVRIIQSSLTAARELYYRAAYGGNQSWESPFRRWQAILEESRASMTCPLGLKVIETNSSQWCFPPGMTYISLEPLMLSQLSNATADTLGQLWGMMIDPLYERFFSPAFNLVLPTIIEPMDAMESKFFAGIITILVVCCALYLITIMELEQVRVHIRSVLRLLLHCPPSVILSTPDIMDVLSGDFSRSKSDGNRGAEFFESVFLRLPDAIIYADSDMVIQRANYSCARLFFEDDLRGKNLRSFFSSANFQGNIEQLFSTSSETLIFHRPDGQESHISVTIVDTGTEFVASCRDVTQMDRWNDLIAYERANSDRLLKRILPESLVPRVQSGERDISFAVEQATITFMDIVGFTSWCSKLPAQRVMSTLNDMFKKFDEILATQPTMTKIKCIGDCYMAAGGIFGNDQATQNHAIEVVTFGLQAIVALRELNVELGERLEIRVGVNTGGPIVAGVLGIGKPTFEILGPAINMAQQMEHTGKPMLVHVSEATYMSVRAGPFTCYCQGATVRGYQVKTYIVTQKSDTCP